MMVKTVINRRMKENTFLSDISKWFESFPLQYLCCVVPLYYSIKLNNNLKGKYSHTHILPHSAQLLRMCILYSLVIVYQYKQFCQRQMSERFSPATYRDWPALTGDSRQVYSGSTTGNHKVRRVDVVRRRNPLPVSTERRERSQQISAPLQSHHRNCWPG